MPRVELARYVGGFRNASARFESDSSDWRVGFGARFEALAWAAAIREHLVERLGRPQVVSESPHLEGAYCVRNLMVHVLPREGGQAPYLAHAIGSHGASLANSMTEVGFQGGAFALGTVVGQLHDTWSGLPSGRALRGIAGE
jgi:hypothetical protein